jgi:hypothetical protein
LEPVPQPRRRSEAVERFRGNIGLRAGKALAGIRTENDDQRTGVDIVRRAIQWPARLIVDNARIDAAVGRAVRVRIELPNSPRPSLWRRAGWSSVRDECEPEVTSGAAETREASVSGFPAASQPRSDGAAR